MDEEVRAANARYAATFELAGLAAAAAKGVVLITCMDSRIEPLAALGLKPGDAKIIRNAGGRVTSDVLRSLVLATSLLGVERAVVMHHTRCALAGKSEAELHASMRTPEAAASRTWVLGAMPDADAALAADVAAIRSSPAFIDDFSVEGWRYDVDTGLVHVVVPPPDRP